MVQPMRRNDLPRRQCIFILRAHFEVGSGKAVAQKRVELPAKYRPTSREEFMSPRMQEYFRRRLDMWRQDILDETDATLEKLRLDTGHEAGPGGSRCRRIRALGPASHAGPRPQAHLEDRSGAAADRGRIIRLLRGNCRADQHPTSRGPPHRDPQRRGAGAPRATRAHPSRRADGRHARGRLTRISHHGHGLRPRPGGRSAWSGPKSVAVSTVEGPRRRGRAPGRDPKGGALGRQCASRRLPDVPASRCAPFLLCRPDRAAQTMTAVRNAG